MIEMRWQETLAKDGTVAKTVLQYRQQVDKTSYALAATNALSAQCINNGQKNWQWSEWQVVPTVTTILG